MNVGTVPEMLAITAAARDYVLARAQLHGADQGGILAALHRCDEAWHALHLACGVACADVADGPIGDDP